MGDYSAATRRWEEQALSAEEWNMWTCATQRVVHFKGRTEHTWSLNIYLNLHWSTREGELAKYNITSFDSHIDEALRLKQTSNK